MSTFAQALGILLSAYRNWDLSREDAEVWAMSLSDVSADDLHVAAFQLVRESKFQPTIAEWRERASALRPAGVATSIADAWDELLRNRKLYQSQRYESRPERLKPYSWSSEAILRAAKGVQWSSDWAEGSLTTTRAQFERYLRQHLESEGVASRAQSALEFAKGVGVLGERAPRPLGSASSALPDGRIMAPGEDWSKVLGSGENGRAAIQGEQVRDEGTRW